MKQIALIAGGSLLMAGAALPWLTLFAGLHPYSGLVGMYGWLIFGAGVIALAAGVATLRITPAWAAWATTVFGSVVLGFALWLMAGLQQTIHRPAAMMFGEAALTLAHDRALTLYKDTKLAVRSQYWMLGVMVGFTSLALWLLAQASA